MYCGSNKTALCSQKQVSDAMLKLLETKKFEDISICELCKVSGISRQTFYTLFSSKENVIVFTLQSKYCCSDQVTEECSIEQLCGEYACYITSNREFLKTLVDNDIIYLLYDSIYETSTECDGTCDCTCEISKQEKKYIAHFLAGGITGIVKAYCLDGCRTSRDELNAILFKLFSGHIYDS